jgi:hypothetical protein
MRSHVDRSAWWLALAGAIGVVAGAAITGAFNHLDHEGDFDAKMIELSVGILRAEPTPETIPLREWAIDVIDKRAKFNFNPLQRAALLNKPLPFKGAFDSGFVFGAGGGSPTGNGSTRSPSGSGATDMPR